jgi:hypothetical protein
MSARLPEQIIGVWKLDACYVENLATGERRPYLGDGPQGYLVLTPDRLTALMTGTARPIPQSDADCAAAFRSMLAYSGRYRIEGDRLTTRVDVSWNEAWTGTDQVRFLRLHGDKLSIETAAQRDANAPGSTEMIKAILEWSRSQ